MRIAVFGAGAIGGHIAARLARGGAEVSVIARGAHLAAIRERGLTVHAPDGVLHASPRASDAARDLGEQDAVIVTVKAPSLPSVATGIAPLLGRDTPVAFVMNGIPWWYFFRHGGPQESTRLPELDPGDGLRRALGLERVLGGVVYSAVTVSAPGVIHSEHANIRVILGELDGAATPRAEALAQALRAGGFASPVVPDIRFEVWQKLLGNLASGPLCLCTRLGVAATFAEPLLAEAAARHIDEAAAIAAAWGRPVPPNTATRIAHGLKMQHKPSILQDLELGRPMEIDALFTLPLRLARMAGVATPTLDLTTALATRAAIAAGLYAPAA